MKTAIMKKNNPNPAEKIRQNEKLRRG